MNIDYNNRFFKGCENYDSGDFNQDTVFHYRQTEDIIWATFRGGGVKFGTAVGTMNEDSSFFIGWQYISSGGDLITGTSVSAPEILPDGRIKIHESWSIDGGESGISSVIETAS